MFAIIGQSSSLNGINILYEHNPGVKFYPRDYYPRIMQHWYGKKMYDSAC